MKSTKAKIIGIIMLFFSVSLTAQALESSFGDMKKEVESGGWTVIWSTSYGFEKAAALTACVVLACAQAYLGKELESLRNRVGTQLLEQALKAKGREVLFGPGKLKIMAGLAYWSTFKIVVIKNPLTNKVVRRDRVTVARYVRLYMKYKRS